MNLIKMATKTKRKKKPTCVKGQPCGYACIPLLKKNGEPRGCGQPVPEDVAEVNLNAVPARGKKSSSKKKAEPKAAKQDANAIWEAAMKDKSKVAMSVIKEVDPKSLKLTKADLDLEAGMGEYDDGDDMVSAIANLAKKQGIDPDTALAMGQGLRAWVGPQYTDCSPLTYRATEQIDEHYDFTTGEPSHIRKNNVAILAAATAALKVLPPVKADDDILKEDPGYKNWDKKTLNRWINVSEEDIDSFVRKYKKGETIAEDGMFGTSLQTAETMGGQFADRNVTYKVKPKLDGSGSGRYIEHLKGGSTESEVLYVPGTKFKVSNVTEEEAEEYDPWEDAMVKKRKLIIELEES